MQSQQSKKSQQFKTGCDYEEFVKCVNVSPSDDRALECLAKNCTDKDFLNQVESSCFIDFALRNDKKTLMNMENETRREILKKMTVECMADKIGRLYRKGY